MTDFPPVSLESHARHPMDKAQVSESLKVTARGPANISQGPSIQPAWPQAEQLGPAPISECQPPHSPLGRLPTQCMVLYSGQYGKLIKLPPSLELGASLNGGGVYLESVLRVPGTVH